MSTNQAQQLHDFFAQFELRMMLARRFRIAEYAGRQREKYNKIYLMGR